jgi:hypothetical protein
MDWRNRSSIYWVARVKQDTQSFKEESVLEGKAVDKGIEIGGPMLPKRRLRVVWWCWSWQGKCCWKSL